MEKEPRGFDKARKEAEIMAKDDAQTGALLNKANKKANKNKKRMEGVWEELSALMRLIAAFRNGDYRVMPWKSMIFALAAIIYFVNPLDVIFDFIPFFGFLDDFGVLAFVVNSIRGDIEKFRKWEQEQVTINIPTE